MIEPAYPGARIAAIRTHPLYAGHMAALAAIGKFSLFSLNLRDDPSCFRSGSDALAEPYNNSRSDHSCAQAIPLGSVVLCGCP